MSREIKFRAYDNDDNEMYFPETISISVGIFKPLRICKDGNRAYKHHELMQFTGLKDKNGKEIFEGDIISHNNNFVKLFENKEVRFWEGAFVAGRCTANDALVNFNCPNYIEIIGNIYENPELLKD